MSENELDEFLEIRKPGAHLDEGVVADDFVLMLGVDLENFPKFPRVDDNVTYRDIQWTLWGETVLPGVKELKAEFLGIAGNTVEDWMKDLQLDATALPGKAFDLSFEMPEPEVGIMTFNRCVAADQWESMGRPDILEKNCHSTCPKSMIVTTKMYNPNMKVEILAIPPRVDPENVCCKWRFSMRDEDDPEFVPVELSPRPSQG